jgi:hypothetical protein
MTGKLILVPGLVALAALFLILATLIAGGVITMSGGGWLEDAGLPTLAVAWFVSLLPV